MQYAGINIMCIYGTDFCMDVCYHSGQNLSSASFLIQKFNDKDIQNYNFVCYFVGVKLGR
jgi:hypothetical protein